MNPYATLGLERSATDAEVRKAHRRVAFNSHPDKNPGDKAARRRFERAQEAYDILSDPQRRRLWDLYGPDSLQPGFAEILELLELLRPTAPGPQRAPPPARHRSAAPEPLHLAFLVALRGGEVVLGDLQLRVPPGTADGDVLAVRSLGLRLVASVAPHPLLHRQGDDLLVDLPVSWLEVYEAKPLAIPTPWGAFHVRNTADLEAGGELVLPGYGVRRTGRPAGNMIVTVKLVAPPPGDLRLLAALQSAQGRPGRFGEREELATAMEGDDG